MGQNEFGKIFEKSNSKKQRKGAGAIVPTRLPFGPLSRAAQLLPASPRARMRLLAPPGAGHVAAVRRRHGRGCPANRHNPVGTPPHAPRPPPFCPLPTPSSCALTLGRLRQGIGLDPISAPWLELRQALGLRESLPSRPSFSSVVSAFWSPHHHKPSATLRSRSIGRRRTNAGEQCHRAPPCAIPTARDLLRGRELVQRVRLAETKP